MNLYLDASALVKRYVAEMDSDALRDGMARADSWFICRTGYVEVVRAVGVAAGVDAAKGPIDEWPAFAIVEVDQHLVEHAATLAIERELRTLDALHLAAALLLPRDGLALATWDRRLHAAAAAEGLDVLPEALA